MGGIFQGESKEERWGLHLDRKNSMCKVQGCVCVCVCVCVFERKRERDWNSTFWTLIKARIQDIKALSKKQRWASEGQEGIRLYESSK